ncbi:MAG TPA: fibronectin type III domain-containing protein, partial [Candidatus Angelobacter sp.]|nr:fibronectin type III domain-containing protein [Candidatus Angelobacter sp.]
MAQKRKSAFQISYVTITYRSVLMGMFGVLLLAAVVMYFAFPDTANKLVLSGQVGLGKVFAKMGLSSGGNGLTPEPGPQQAHFTNIDGNVRVRKATTNTWIVANYSQALERGDVVQTSPEGVAKIVFTDGTNYTVKPGSLITIQESSMNSAQQTKTKVEVTTGKVDMATSTLMSGSKSQVIVGDATATIASESSAEVVNDNRIDQHEILVKKGSGEVTREGQTIPLESYTKAEFNSSSKGMIKSKVLQPPTLISPAPMQNVFVDQASKAVNFSWAPVDNVREYRIRVSRNPSFAGPVVVDDKKPSTQVMVTNLQEGVTYYWQVSSIGQDGKESIESEIYKFTVVPKGTGLLALEVGDLVQMGHVIELKGHTEPNAHVMVNGQEAVVGPDGAFHHFTNPLP